jgi:hypothetical protein
MPAKNRIIRLSVLISKINMEAKAPKPYTGHKGPFKNPRFTRLRSLIEQIADS